MRAFYIYAPPCGLFMFTPHYAGFLYVRPTMRAFISTPHYTGFCLATQRQDTRGDNKMLALACPCEN